MDVKIYDTITKKIKFYLIFFCFALLLSCDAINPKTNLKVVYKENKAVAIQFNVAQQGEIYKVFLEKNSKTPILGNLSFENETTIFRPIAPFTPGEIYYLYQNDTFLSHFQIKGIRSQHPELITIYPTKDTVPENLLKMYFVFSEPMQEVGNPLDYITIKNISDQREESVFLDLEAELWNREHTQLTLWLDPGRIKTDLIPNKEKGLPIINGKEYRIIIDSNWRSANGQPLKQKYEKSLYVSSRDGHSPIVSKWKVSAPKFDTKDFLKIDFNESLDAMLTLETIQFFHGNGTLINGKIELQSSEKGIVFYPKTPWKKGKYTIQIATKLEDLAGNNLNHVFDRNLSEETSTPNKTIKQESIDFNID